MKIYYGLTEEESKLKVLRYKGNNKYEYKAVNTSLIGLRRFINDSGLCSLVRYYVVLDSNVFEINEDILFDEKYDMIAVKIPFEFEIKNVKKLLK